MICVTPRCFLENEITWWLRKISMLLLEPRKIKSLSLSISLDFWRTVTSEEIFSRLVPRSAPNMIWISRFTAAGTFIVCQLDRHPDSPVSQRLFVDLCIDWGSSAATTPPAVFAWITVLSAVRNWVCCSFWVDFLVTSLVFTCFCSLGLTDIASLSGFPLSFLTWNDSSIYLRVFPSVFSFAFFLATSVVYHLPPRSCQHSTLLDSCTSSLLPEFLWINITSLLTPHLTGTPGRIMRHSSAIYSCDAGGVRYNAGAVGPSEQHRICRKSFWVHRGAGDTTFQS
jgi:hypothetical protein